MDKEKIKLNASICSDLINMWRYWKEYEPFEDVYEGDIDPLDRIVAHETAKDFKSELAVAICEYTNNTLELMEQEDE